MKVKSFIEDDLSIIKNRLNEIITKDTVFCCIGTDKHIADSYGPFVGTFLKENNIEKVFGTIEYPLHAVNLEERMDRILSKYDNNNIIGIDASLSVLQDVHKIIINDVPIHPGRGVGKNLSGIGKYSVLFTVASSRNVFNDLLDPHNIRIYDIIRHSKTLANIISEIVKEKNI